VMEVYIFVVPYIIVFPSIVQDDHVHLFLLAQ
jgi:hypothetical protein